MNRNLKQQDDGFTIIEVVLVLAIAALIMLMVFLALPALQRGQRDTTRKNDVSRVQSALNNYKSRNRGVLPTATSPAYNTFFGNDLRRAGDQFDDPSAGPYNAEVATSGSFSGGTGMPTYEDSTAGNIWIYPGLSCDGENANGTVNTTARKVAIIKPLEGGGRHCAEA
jgi:prepilin-type N-terminal cleavage/methylation domain-containing protein